MFCLLKFIFEKSRYLLEKHYYFEGVEEKNKAPLLELCMFRLTIIFEKH